jgi:hypothetical protein
LLKGVKVQKILQKRKNHCIHLVEPHKLSQLGFCLVFHKKKKIKYSIVA